MDLDELVKVYTLCDAGLAEIIRASLQDEGIPCQLGGRQQAGFTGTVEIDVLVRAVDADKARRLILAHE